MHELRGNIILKCHPVQQIYSDRTYYAEIIYTFFFKLKIFMFNLFRRVWL